jgi:hypothetical protein
MRLSLPAQKVDIPSRAKIGSMAAALSVFLPCWLSIAHRSARGE